MATTKIEIGKKNKRGERPVSILICNNKTKKRVSTGISLVDSDFTASGKIKNKELSMKIEKLKRQYDDFLFDLSREVFNISSYDAADLVELYASTKNNVKEIDFFEFAEHWMSNATIKGIKNYRLAIRKLQEFTKKKRLPITQITFPLLVGFEKYLKDKPRAQSLYLGLLRHLFREAIREYNSGIKPVITYDPFSSYKVPRQVIKKGVRAITQEELLRIYNFKGKPYSRAQLARDCFILSFCLMGINSADLYNCSKLKSNVLAYNRTKTKDRRSDSAYIEVVIQLQISSLVKKYRSSGTSHVFNFYERYTNANEFNRALNKGLKQVGVSVGIENLQFYQARHTFATLSRNLMHFSKGDVDEALNHVGSYDIADIYIKKDFSIINENNKKLLKKVFKNQ